MDNIDVFDIVKSYLLLNGYDGLYQDQLCGCDFSALMICENPQPDCKAGYRIPDGDDSYWIVGDKPED